MYISADPFGRRHVGGFRFPFFRSLFPRPFHDFSAEQFVRLSSHPCHMSTAIKPQAKGDQRQQAKNDKQRTADQQFWKTRARVSSFTSIEWYTVRANVPSKVLLLNMGSSW